jgi:transcription initiation factor TFIID TATA-box-binding protein
MKQKQRDDVTFQIQNIVSTFNCGVSRLNLKKQCLDNTWTQINQEVFAALIGRFEDPKTTLLTFTSGNNVCTGAKDVQQSRLACRMVLNVWQENGMECSLGAFKVQNMVASITFTRRINIHAISRDFPLNATYDPDVFPGLIFRWESTKMVFLIFNHGKIVATGGKCANDMYDTFCAFRTSILDTYIGEVPDPRFDVEDWHGGNNDMEHELPSMGP